ncbi:putative F-box protein At1g67623 [Lycium ferocissimum]|uniref:putative F-box protein At1g67623 n=1 Tax=Lycium ferocissimum TaxID=112874 RepID=UPI0028152EEA|nr:putative F-box protein At1g67623 [Lycium ferocissimum]
MVISRHARKIMKRRGRKNNKLIKDNFCSSIESLPNELLTEIVARVASFSFKSYINAKLSCKVFHEVANERYVYQNATLVDFPLLNLWLKPKQEKINKITSFLELCRECGNTEALYRKGVMDLFRNDRPELALELVKRAAKGGHIGAFYVIGIIMVFMGGDFKRKGVILIGNMKKTRPLRKITRECRKKLVKILRNIWVLNPLVYGERPTCCTIQHQRIRKNGWPVDSDDEDEDKDIYFRCDACNCDAEIAYIFAVLRR